MKLCFIQWKDNNAIRAAGTKINQRRANYLILLTVHGCSISFLFQAVRSIQEMLYEQIQGWYNFTFTQVEKYWANPNTNQPYENYFPASLYFSHLLSPGLSHFISIVTVNVVILDTQGQTHKRKYLYRHSWSVEIKAKKPISTFIFTYTRDGSATSNTPYMTSHLKDKTLWMSKTTKLKNTISLVAHTHPSFGYFTSSPLAICVSAWNGYYKLSCSYTISFCMAAILFLTPRVFRMSAVAR